MDMIPGKYKFPNSFLPYFQKHMSADLTKGSFGHCSSFCVIKISKKSKFSRFCKFLQYSQIDSNM